MRALFFLLLLGLLSCTRRKVEIITVRGSDTEVNLVLQLAEAYMDADPSVSVNVSGGGSGVGIAGLLNGRTDVANSSRDLLPQENALAAERHIDIRPFVFATDALAIICHPSLRIDSLTLPELGDIFSGAYSNWQEIGAGNGPISLYGRQSNSGTFMYFRERVLGKDYSPQLKQMNGNAQILEAVKSDPNAIGYIGFGYLSDDKGNLRDGIRVLKLCSARGKASISPLDEAQIKAGLYPLTRPLYHFTDGEPIHKTRAFFEFEKSAAGQEIIRQNGYLPAAIGGFANSEK